MQKKNYNEHWYVDIVNDHYSDEDKKALAKYNSYLEE